MKTSVALSHWIPRILCILAILFVSMFALDSFAPGLTIWKQLGSFLIHLIPCYILIALLVIAWKREYLGGLLFVIIGVIFIPFVFIHNYHMNHSFWISLSIVLVINIPFVVVGLLFIRSHYLKK